MALRMASPPEIESLLKLGNRPYDIMKLFPKTTHSQIQAVRRRLGIAPFKSGRRPGGGQRSKRVAERIEKAKLMKASGLTYKQIGKHFGVSRQMVQQYLRPNITVLEKCAKCGATENLLVHHRDYRFGLIEILCTSCHSKLHSRRKLNDESVRTILSSRGLTRSKLAEKSGVAKGTIDDILSGRTWTHIQPGIQTPQIS